MLYRTSITLPSGTRVHTSWTKVQAMKWLYVNKRTSKAAVQQFSKITDLFGRTIAVRYYR